MKRFLSLLLCLFTLANTAFADAASKTWALLVGVELGGGGRWGGDHYNRVPYPAVGGGGGGVG